MTEIQFLTLLGTIYIAPHLRKDYCFVVGVFFLAFAIGKQLGFL